MKNKIFKILLFGVFVLCLTFVNSRDVLAESIFDESGTMGQKALYAGALKRCYLSTGYVRDFKTNIKLSEFDGTYDGLLTKETPSVAPWFGMVFDSNGMLRGFSCRDVMTAKIANPVSRVKTTDNAEKEKRLTDLFYKKISNGESVSNNDDSHCYQYYLLYDKYDDGAKVDSGVTYTQQLCVKKENNNSITYVKDVAGQKTGIVSFSNLGKDELTIKVDTGGENLGFLGKSDSRTISSIYEYDSSRVLAAVGQKISEMVGTSSSNVERTETDYYGPMDHNGYQASREYTIRYRAACTNFNYILDDGGVECKSGDNVQEEYSVRFNKENVPDAEYALNTQVTPDGIINRLSGGAFDQKLKLAFTQDEQYELYQYYLKNVFGVSSIQCASEQIYDSGTRTARLWWNEKKTYSPYCNFKVTANENASVWGVGDDGLFGKEMSLDDMIGKLNSLSNNAAPSSTVDDQHDPGTTVDPSEVDCYGAENLNGMAWILCPTVLNLEGTAIGVSGLIDSWLEVENKFYDAKKSDGSETETHRIWSFMRGAANVVLIIILLSIIFSQLTGYGIDNYGIKKMLPKFVVMVILINLSFVLCQLAIDLSNILGYGLKNLLTTIASNHLTFGELLASLVDGGLALLTAAGGGSGLIITGIMIGTSGGNVAVIIVFILALLAVLIGVLMFVMMLGARTIIIIVGTALSPLALACYILPNTQKWYKNWWKMFQTALIIYPICGAMYGISQIIISLVYKPDGMDMLLALIAMITPVLPYYIMPTLLKNAMSTLGSVGSVINSIGNSVRKGISEGSHTLQNTGSYKSGTETSQRNMNTWRAGYSRNRKTGALEERKLNRFQKAIRGGKIGMSNAKAAMVRDEEKINAENNLNNDTLMARLDEVSSKQADLDAKSYETQLRSGKIEGVNADNADTVASNLTDLLEKYHKSGDNGEKRVLMSKIRGAQAILAESKPGREKVQKAYEDAIKGGYDSALYGGNGAAHYYRQSAGASLNKTKSMDEMVTDLTKSMDNKASDAIRNNVENSYTNKALEKYNADTFANADSKELERYLANIDIMGDDEAGKKYKTSLYKLINDAEKSETISISGQVQNLFDQMKAKIGPMPVAGASNGAAVENQEFKVQGVGSAPAPDQYTAPTRPQPKTPGQQMSENGQQWANEVSQNSGTVTKSGIWVPESNNRKPSNPKPNNGGGVM